MDTEPMKIPSHQLHHSIQEGDIFEANGFDFICTGRDEECLYCERLICENDIPSKLDLKCYPKTEKRLKSVRKFGRERWKPNGITDNREEWRRKNNRRKGLELLTKIVKLSGCSVDNIKNLNP